MDRDYRNKRLFTTGTDVGTPVATKQVGFFEENKQTNFTKEKWNKAVEDWWKAGEVLNKNYVNGDVNKKNTDFLKELNQDITKDKEALSRKIAEKIAEYKKQDEKIEARITISISSIDTSRLMSKMFKLFKCWKKLSILLKRERSLVKKRKNMFAKNLINTVSRRDNDKRCQEIFDDFLENFTETSSIFESVKFLYWNYKLTLDLMIFKYKTDFRSCQSKSAKVLLSRIEVLFKETEKIFKFHEELEQEMKANMKWRIKTPNMYRSAKLSRFANKKKKEGKSEKQTPRGLVDEWGSGKKKLLITDSCISSRSLASHGAKGRFSTITTPRTALVRTSNTERVIKNDEKSPSNNNSDSKISWLKVFFISFISLALLLLSSCISYFVIKNINQRLSKKKQNNNFGLDKKR